jgi:hypothetical protein
LPQLTRILRRMRPGFPCLATGAIFAGLLATPAAAAPTGWRTYTDEKLGYAISYPAGWTLDKHYIYGGFGPDHEIRGVAFQIPQSLTKGTNLSASRTVLSVETVQGNTCNAARFIPDPPYQKTIHDGRRRWSTASATEGAAGNFYETAVFALPERSPCIAVRYSIHSTNIGNYDPGTVQPFDRAGLLKTFAAIRHTLGLKSDRAPHKQ